MTNTDWYEKLDVPFEDFLYTQVRTRGTRPPGHLEVLLRAGLQPRLAGSHRQSRSQNTIKCSYSNPYWMPLYKTRTWSHCNVFSQAVLKVPGYRAAYLKTPWTRTPWFLNCITLLILTDIHFGCGQGLGWNVCFLSKCRSKGKQGGMSLLIEILAQHRASTYPHHLRQIGLASTRAS